MKAKTSKWTVMFASVLTILTAHFGLCTTLGTPDPELEAAIGTYNKSQFREALASFSALAQKKRNEPRIQYYLGLCYFQLGDKVQARRFLEWIFDSPADSWTKTQAALALNRLNGIKEITKPAELPDTAQRMIVSRGTDSNGVMIGLPVGQICPGQGKLRTTGYCVYTPKDYDGREKLPWILALSPSGRSDDWELLQESCDKHHWALVMSQNSNCSIPWSELEPHLRDTIESAPNRFPLDPGGLCLAGFSGGGSLAYRLASVRKDVRKVIVVNACIKDKEIARSSLCKGKSVVLIGGSMDSNSSLMRSDKLLLDKCGWKTKWVGFQGGHQFAPAGAYEEAIEWLNTN